MTSARQLIFIAGLCITIAGLAALWMGWHPVALLVVGGLILAGTLFDQIYGAPAGRPQGKGWKMTGEKFVDPETGEPAEVWFNPETGERRYVGVSTGRKQPE